VRAREPGANRIQRATGFAVLAFVAIHLWELRFQRMAFGLDASAVGTVLVSHLSWTWHGLPLVALGYVAGLLATCFHFGHGLRLAARAFGMADDARRARRIDAVTAALGSALFLAGTVSVVALATGTRLLPASDDVTGPCGSALPQAPLPKGGQSP
jgi:succinate dehydrogenase/fumarate reductase cytochrome b subunit